MRIGLADVPSPVLRRRRVVLEGSKKGWRDFESALALAGFAFEPDPGHPTADSEAYLMADALAFVHDLTAAQRKKLEAVADKAPALQDVQLRKPIDADGKMIVTAGREALSRSNEQLPAKMVVGFSKFSDALTDPDAAIRFPSGRDNFDADAGIAAVLGGPAARATAAEGGRAIVGFTLMLDVTDREMFDEERRTNNSLFAKNCEACTPLGPSIWIARERDLDPNTEIKMSVNGEVRQRYRVAHLAHNIKTVTRDWSRATLETGDVLGLGAAIAWPRDRNLVDSPIPIKRGDLIEVSCKPIGVLRATVAN